MEKEITMQIEKWEIGRLSPYAHSPRKNDHAVKAMVKAIRTYGFRVPLLARSDGEIIDGHLRLKAAKAAGLTEVPVISVDDLTEAQIKAFRISINRMAELAEWDLDLLKMELENLSAMDFSLDLTGLDDALVEKLLGNIRPTEGLTDPDSVPDLPAEPVTRPGNVWLLGRHRLLCGDSTSIDCMRRLLSGEHADLVFTDPPYNVDYKGGTKDALTIKNDKMKSSDFYEFLYNCFAAAAAVCRPGTPIYVCHADSESINFRQSLIDSGWLVKSCLIWVKNHFKLGRMDYHMRHEPILYGWKAGGPHKWFGGRKLSTVIEEMPGLVITPNDAGAEMMFSDGERFCTIQVPSYEIIAASDDTTTTIWKVNKPLKSPDHPTTKPVDIPRRAILNSSLNGNNILDLFLGSGSTLIACEMSGRICYGMEVDPKYCDVIVKRWEQFTGRKAELAN